MADIRPFPTLQATPQRQVPRDLRVDLAEVWDLVAYLIENIVVIGTNRLDGAPLSGAARPTLQGFVDSARMNAPKARALAAHYRSGRS